MRILNIPNDTMSSQFQDPPPMLRILVILVDPAEIEKETQSGRKVTDAEIKVFLSVLGS